MIIKVFLATIRNYKGHTISHIYDSWGRKASTTYADGTTESTSLTWSNSPTDAIFLLTLSATGQPDTQTYLDEQGREIRNGQKRFDGTYLYTDNVYDSKGRLEKSSLPFKSGNPSSWNKYTYDYYDRVTELAHASGKKDLYSYGKLKTISVIDSVSTTKNFDATGEVISIEDAAGIITYNLRPDGQPSSIIAPGNVTTSFEYDIYGRQIKLNDPSAGSKSFAYDAAGNINYEKDAKGKETKMVYDIYNRLKTKEVVGELTTTYDFNTDGLLKSIISTNGTSKTYTYDDLLRIGSEKENIVDGKWFKKTFAYKYGNLASTLYTSQSEDIVTENYEYANGHHTEIKLNGSTSIWKLIAENNLGMPTLSSTGSLSRTYSYDEFGLPTGRQLKKGSTIIQDFGYNFNPQTGNLNWRKDNTRNLQKKFEYDKLNRLTVIGGNRIYYDNKGNITYFPHVGQFKYNNSTKPYALTTIASCKEGDIKGLHNYQREQSITYNSMMRPASISEDGQITTFTYNSDGDRVKMHTLRNGVNELERYYLGGQYEIDQEIAGIKERLYLGGDVYSAAAVYVKQGTEDWAIHYIGRDYQGSITHITNAEGILEQELSYDPWGRLRNPVNQILYPVGEEILPTLGSRGYTGHEHLINYGLINMNARLYDPVVGRFLSPDPYVQSPEFSQSFNRYSYCWNNPFRYTDPNGEYVLIDDLIAGVLGGVINLAGNAISGNVHSWGEGFSYFGIGFGAGVATLYSGPVAGGMIVAGGNSIVNQGFTDGFNNISWGQVGTNTLMGGITGAVSAGAGSLVQKPLNSAFSSVASPVLRQSLVQGTTGTISGFVTNTTMSRVNGSSWEDALYAGREGAIWGLTLGTVGGAYQGLKYARSNNLDPWTGKSNLRMEYESKVRSLESLADQMNKQGASDEQIARQLHQLRREIGLEYKNLTPKNTLDQIYQRNMQKYGDQYGPSIEYLKLRGKSWGDIIKSSYTPGGKDLNFRK